MVPTQPFAPPPPTWVPNVDPNVIFPVPPPKPTIGDTPIDAPKGQIDVPEWWDEDRYRRSWN